MSVELVSITLTLDAPAITGTMVLRHDDPGYEIEGELHQVEVQQLGVLPGYELVTPDGDLVPDDQNPVGREAHRLMRMLLMPNTEIAAREAAVRQVLSTGALAVLEDVDVWRTHLAAFIKGEITREQLGWLAENTNRLAASPAPVVEPALSTSSIPQQWWDALKKRMRKHDPESTVTLVQAANMLGWTPEDLQQAVDDDRVATTISEMETRVSRWQFEPDFDDTTPATHKVIPGVDIILAVLPRQARDGRTFGHWMSTPHPALLLEREPVSPRTWLRARNPLVDVITALTSIR